MAVLAAFLLPWQGDRCPKEAFSCRRKEFDHRLNRAKTRPPKFGAIECRAEVDGFGCHPGNSGSRREVTIAVELRLAALFPEFTSQRTTGGTTQCGTADTSYCGARCTARRTANDGAGFSLALGGDGCSRAAAHGATDDLTGTSADAFADGGASGTADGAADRRLCSAVSGERRARRQQASADRDCEQCGVFHLV